MELSNTEKIQIRQLLQSPQWATAERLASLLTDSIAYNSKVKETQWDTMRTLLLEEGEVRGIRKYIQELYNAAQN